MNFIKASAPTGREDTESRRPLVTSGDLCSPSDSSTISVVLKSTATAVPECRAGYCAFGSG